MGDQDACDEAAPEPTRGLRAQQPRFYEVWVTNRTSRHFGLFGEWRPRLRQTVKGRFTQLAPEIPGGKVSCPRTPSTSSSAGQALRVAQATFCDRIPGTDALEFNMSFISEGGQGFTIRVHAHSCSAMRSDAIAEGEELQVSSAWEEVPRYRVSPPSICDEKCLGVYASPGLCDAERVGKLVPGEEVVATSGAPPERWLEISHPLQGWILAELRDGRPLIERLHLERPHMRQVITVQPSALCSKDQHREVHTARLSRGLPETRMEEALYSAARHRARDPLERECVRMAEHKRAVQMVRGIF